MNSSVFQTVATVETVSTLADGSVKLSIYTPELPPESMATLFALARKEGWLAFKESEVRMEDLEIPEVAVEFKTDKSPSQRLRNVLYKLWEQTSPTTDFDSFYKTRMEKLIEQIKAKLG